MDPENILSKEEELLWKYIKKYDFEGNPWSTPEAAKKLEMPEDKVYKALSELVKKLPGQIFLYYRDGALRIQTG
jgi:hypothetical protein